MASYRKKVTKKTTKRYKRKSSRRPASKSLRRAVRAVVKRQAETKTIQRYNLGQSLVPANHVNFQANIIELGPGANMVISQGTGQGQRIGNRIETVHHSFRGNIVAYPYNATTNTNPEPVQVKLWIFYDKTDPVAAPLPVTYPFFQDGNGVIGFANDLVDTWRPVNTDRYRVLATRVFKVGQASFAGTATSTTNRDYWQAYANNDYKLNCHFNINLTPHQIKKIRYNDTNNEPTTRRLFAMFQPISATGGNIGATQIPCGVSYMEDFRFKDL